MLNWKRIFSYDYVDSYDKIYESELPSNDLFLSKMKNAILVIKNITLYQCLQGYQHENVSRFSDFLEWYNNLDVLPFVEAVEKWKRFIEMKDLINLKKEIHYLDKY